MATNLLTCCERLDESKYRHKCACPSAVAVCESEQVNPELCGLSEFTGDGVVASTPPKKYRLQTQTYTGLSYTFNKCCQPHFTQPYEVKLARVDASTSDFVSTLEYDSLTCNLGGSSTNGNILVTTYQYCDDLPTGTSNRIYNDVCGGLSGNTTNTVASNTLKNQNCEDTEYFNQSAEDPCVGEIKKSLSGTGTTVLSVEDTEADAEARETPTIGTSCSSLWETRSTGFGWTVRTSGYTIECDDLVIGIEYEVAPSIRKRTAVIDSYGAWEDVAVTPVTFTATAKTETIDDGGDPIELDHIQGYEYEITSVNIEKTA
jgi:hypothetical protein